MTRRRLVWLAVVVCFALAVVLTHWATSQPHPVNQESFQRIQVGMTLAEVEAIFGCLPGDYTTGNYPDGFFIPSEAVGDPPNPDTRRKFATKETWTSDQGSVEIWFDEDGMVGYAYYSMFVPTPPRRSPPSLLNRLRAWLGW